MKNGKKRASPPPKNELDTATRLASEYVGGSTDRQVGPSLFKKKIVYKINLYI